MSYTVSTLITMLVIYLIGFEIFAVGDGKIETASLPIVMWQETRFRSNHLLNHAAITSSLQENAQQKLSGHLPNKELNYRYLGE